MNLEHTSYEIRKETYNSNYGLSSLNTSLENRLALVSLICYLTYKLKQKKPGVTCYQVIMKIVSNQIIDKYFENFLISLSIMCDEAMKNTTEFSNFGIQTSKEVVKKIREILGTWLPF